MFKNNWIVVIGILVILLLITTMGFAEESKQNNLTIPEIAGLQGGYLPKNDIIIGDYKLECIQIYSDEKKIEKIFIEVIDKKKKIKLFKCENYLVKSDRIVIKSTTTVLGNISFDGIFLPVENGDYLGTSENNTVVLKGKLIITKEGKRLYINNNQEFTFLYGD